MKELILDKKIKYKLKLQDLEKDNPVLTLLERGPNKSDKLTMEIALDDEEFILDIKKKK